MSDYVDLYAFIRRITPGVHIKVLRLTQEQFDRARRNYEAETGGRWPAKLWGYPVEIR